MPCQHAPVLVLVTTRHFSESHFSLVPCDTREVDTVAMMRYDALIMTSLDTVAMMMYDAL